MVRQGNVPDIMQQQNLSPSQRETVLRIVADLRTRPGSLLEILHGVQAMLGYVPPAAVPVIAEQLNISRAEAHGVVTFYHHFRHAPAGRHTLQMCRAESCQAMGGAALADQARQQLGIDFKQTTADGAVTLESVYCLGNCACSPAVMLDGAPHGRMTPQRLNELIATVRPQP
jgi:formate dehydrogenase subunit gamma